MPHTPDQTRLLPLDFDGLSKPIEKANRAAHKAADAYAAALNARDEISAELLLADDADQRAVAAALDAGEKPPAPTRPKLQAELDAANLEVDAREAALKATRRELYGELERGYPNYIAGLEQQAEDAAVAVRDQADQLGEAIVKFRESNGSYQLARTFHAANPRAVPISTRGADRFGAAFEKALAARRRTLNVKRGATISPSLELILAALVCEVEHDLAGQAINSHDRPDPALLRHERPTAEQAAGELRAEAVRERLEAEGYRPPRRVATQDRRDPRIAA